MARVLGIARCAVSRAPMETCEAASVSCAEGLAGDCRGKPGPRQVTLLSREAWEATCSDLAEELPWTTRRANVLIEGLDLAETSGRKIRLGDLLLEVSFETDPCSLMEKQRTGLRKALSSNWRGGVCCKVLEGGALKVGDAVAFED